MFYETFVFVSFDSVTYIEFVHEGGHRQNFRSILRGTETKKSVKYEKQGGRGLCPPTG